MEFCHYEFKRSLRTYSKVFKCDVVCVRDVTDKHNIQNLPSFVFYHNKEYIESIRFRIRFILDVSHVVLIAKHLWSRTWNKSPKYSGANPQLLEKLVKHYQETGEVPQTGNSWAFLNLSLSSLSRIYTQGDLGGGVKCKIKCTIGARNWKNKTAQRFHGETGDLRDEQSNGTHGNANCSKVNLGFDATWITRKSYYDKSQKLRNFE